MSAHLEYDPAKAQAAAEAYDAQAEATGYIAPRVASDLACEHVRPGQSLLDIGIGTGLGSFPFREAGLRVAGMDVSQEMLDVCRWKGYADLTLHDLTVLPYPYASGVFDHVLCLGVLPFFSDLSPVFAEASRVLRSGGLFTFLVLDRTDEQSAELLVGPERTGTGESVTLYRHSRGRIGGWLGEYGLALVDEHAFLVFRDAERLEGMPARCYLARKGGINPARRY